MEIREPQTDGEWAAYYGLRWHILRKPLGMPEETAYDTHDGGAFHLAAFENGRLVGVGRLHRVDRETAQVRYMAVLPGQSGKGVGRQLLEALVEQARKEGFTRVVLNSRQGAVRFYEKAGFTGDGEYFPLHNIPHKEMHLIL